MENSKSIAVENGGNVHIPSIENATAPSPSMVSNVPEPSAPGAMPVATTTEEQEISADEIALYDRQIRLWGVKAQERLRTANILLIGMKGLGNEIAKNLVLAGIGSLTIQDDGVLTAEDLGAQFLCTENDLGTNRALACLPALQRLNPRVKITTLTSPILINPPTIFTPYSITIATDLPLATLSTLNASCRLCNCPFYASQTFGFYGYIFADLITHTFIIEREKSNVPTAPGPETPTRTIVATSTRKADNGKLMEIVTKSEVYSPMLLANTSPLPAASVSTRRRKLAIPPLISVLRALFDFQSISSPKIYPGHTSHDDLRLFTELATERHKELQLPPETLRAEFLRMFLQNLGSEIAPVTAFLGGQLAQDVINVLGGREQPIQNFLFFDGDGAKGPIYALHPIFEPLVEEKMTRAVPVRSTLGVDVVGAVALD